MRVKTALKKSRSSVRVLGVALPSVLAAFLCFRRWQLAAIPQEKRQW
ncbi:MAG TPA: hypothetical protein VFD38_03375 [Myxococcaceae bacterium]|nr:hypothetical protein [Myxococcaceae bacterium]